MRGFDDWNKDKDWWKSSSEETFREWWTVLEENSCWHTEDIATMFDDMIGAIQNEYGG